MSNKKLLGDFNTTEEITAALNSLPSLVEQGIVVRKVERTPTQLSIFIDEPKKGLPFLERGSVIYRDPINRDVLDLIKPSPLKEEPSKLFERSIDYYYTKGIFGSVIDTLANFATKGFENDIDDPEIKYFFDSWNLQVNFDEVLEWIFFDFFRTGFVRTYKVYGKYLPPISYLKPPKSLTDKGGAGTEYGARKLKWSSSNVPIRYTVLNPTQLIIEGSLLFDQATVFLKPSKELRDLVNKPDKNKTKEEKELLKKLPSDFIKAIKNGGNIPLDPNLVGAIDYRKMPYEKYPKPRGVRAFDSLDFKEKLKEADFSTLDGITNAILKITIGNDQFPVTSQEELERVAALFNTTSKSFNVVWNHTLNIEKITSPEISAILGNDKYQPVNEDLTGAFGIVRALIDGVGNISKGTAELAVKSIIEEVNYARRQVTRWIYGEYREVAEAVGFDRHPKVRWDDKVLKDELLLTSLIQGMIDRRIISYRTGHEMLGLDYDTELHRLSEEKPLVLKGDLGLWGSPYNPKAQPYMTPDTTNPDNDGVVPKTNSPKPSDTQLTPKGTPSEGRPRGKPGKKKMPNNPINTIKAPKVKSPSQAKLVEMVSSMTEDEILDLLQGISKRKDY